MRILADENFPRDAIIALQHQRYDVVWVRTDAPGSSDRDILERAQAENRIIVTFDKDFGELAFRFKLPATSGIILFRITASSSMLLAHMVVAALAIRTDWAGHFAVVEASRIRMRLLSSCEDDRTQV